MIDFKKNAELSFFVLISIILISIFIKQLTLFFNIKQLRKEVDVIVQTNLNKGKEANELDSLAYKLKGLIFCSITREERVKISFLDIKKNVKINAFPSCSKKSVEKEIFGRFWDREGTYFIELGGGEKNELFKMTSIVFNPEGRVESFHIENKHFKKDLCEREDFNCEKN